MNSQKTPHNTYSRTSYGLFRGSLEKNGPELSRVHCIVWSNQLPMIFPGLRTSPRIIVTLASAIVGIYAVSWRPLNSQRTSDTIITSLLRQNDVATSFSHKNDVIFAPCVRWDRSSSKQGLTDITILVPSYSCKSLKIHSKFGNQSPILK